MRGSRFLAVCLFAASTVWIDVERAEASGTCDTSYTYPTQSQNGYKGYTNDPSSWAQTPEGVSGYVEARLGPVCSNLGYPYTFSTAWVMLQDAGQTTHYAQAGYIYDTTAGCNRYFTEWNIGPTPHRTLGNCTSDGEKVTSRVEYQGSPGRHPSGTSTMLLSAGSLSVAAALDPWARGWSFSPTFAGEVTDKANDVPGSVYYQADESALGIQSVSTGDLVQIPCYLDSYYQNVATRYHHTAYSCDHFALWTNPY